MSIESKPQHSHEHEPEHIKKHKRKKKKTRRALRTVAIVAASLLALIALSVVAFSIWTKAPDNSGGLKEQGTAAPTAETLGITPEAAATPKPTSNAQTVPVSPTPTPTATPVPTPTPTPKVEVVRREGVYTLLVVGRDKVGMNTDTIMVIRLDTVEGTVNVVSIPRDTLVNVPWAVKKANSIYGNTGIEGLVDGIEDLIGFSIDNYVVVNTFIFQQVIDSMGGVYFNVPMYMDYDDPDQDLHIHLNAGYQYLNGAQAEGVIRFRQNNDGSGYGQGDLRRIETQQAFLKTVAEQLLSIGNIGNLPYLIDLVVQYTDTDLTNANIAFYAQEFFKLKSGAVRFYTMPYETVYIRGGSYVSIQLQPWLDMVNAYLNPFNVDVTAANLDVITYGENGFSSTTGVLPDMGSFYSY